MNDIEYQKALHRYAQAYVDYMAVPDEEKEIAKAELDAATLSYSQIQNEALLHLAWSSVIHPWNENFTIGRDGSIIKEDICNLCWHERDARCLRCGRSISNVTFACECNGKQIIGPCVKKEMGHT